MMSTIFQTEKDARDELNKIDYDPKEHGCIVTNANVLMTMQCFFRVSKIVCDPQFIARTIQKIREWIEEFEGNDQEGVLNFFMKANAEIGQAHREIRHNNVYMFRSALTNVMSCGTKLLTPLELILLQMLMTDEDELNDLETDMDFFGEFMNMPEEHEKLARIDFLKECNERVNKRTCICQIVTLECIV